MPNPLPLFLRPRCSSAGFISHIFIFIPLIWSLAHLFPLLLPPIFVSDPTYVIVGNKMAASHTHIGAYVCVCVYT